MLHSVPCLHAASTLAESILMYHYSLSVSNHTLEYRRLQSIFDGDRSAPRIFNSSNLVSLPWCVSNLPGKPLRSLMDRSNRFRVDMSAHGCKWRFGTEQPGLMEKPYVHTPVR
jgi:hypothetical protein